MYAYSINFIVALSFAVLLPAICRNPLKRRILAAICSPIILYVLFYNFDYGLMGGVFPFLIAYMGTAFAVCTSLLVVSFHRAQTYSEYFARPIMKFLFSEIFVCLFLFVVFSSPWAIDTFPLSNVEAVLFTVFAGANEGAEEFVISSFVDKVVFPALWTSCILLIVQVFFSFVLFKKGCFYSAKLWKFKLNIGHRFFLQILWQIQKAVLIFLGVYAAILLFILPGIASSTPFKALFQRPVDSKLYREHYVHPDSVKIEMHGEAMNLIVIFLESMEKNFARHTPEIVSQEKDALDFLPGGQNTSGTSWTIAAITGKLCGIPLNMPMEINEYQGKLPTYLPHAKCLMNILAEREYNQLCMQGSNAEFTQLNKFFDAHGNVAVHDFEYYKTIGKIPEKYKVFWGFEDRKLYRFAKEEIDSIANLGKPFAVYLSTIDTHQPDGYLDDSCRIALTKIGFDKIENNIYPAVLRCASMQLDSLLNWMRKQPWFDRTVIFVMGDHANRNLSPKAGVPQSDSLYWTSFVINSAVRNYRYGRAYSSLDMFPTILESMGLELSERAIGLGISLYADNPTLVEIYGRKVLDSLLRERSIQYDELLMGKKK